ncbi:unnamed protein product, partial [Mesorhabditis belari]|uniref:Gamma-glutamylcyclotransferase family protein n=1 Tax=Mesorhabditis belari TaxID=2138241 RepID=A0AAF3EAJ3_9BILA
MFPIRVFVYGTLKRGEPNEHHLTLSSGIQQFIGSGKTSNKFPLIIASKFNIPMVLRERGFGNQIRGEVYEINEEKLQCLDQLEAYPELYTREIEQIELDSGDVTNAWMYMVHEWRPDIYQQSSELLKDYSSKGSHGREYVDSEDVSHPDQLYDH